MNNLQVPPAVATYVDGMNSKTNPRYVRDNFRRDVDNIMKYCQEALSKYDREAKSEFVPKR